MPRVLVVTYPWLPAFSGVVKLVATLCRYLPEAGWDPTILTRDWSGGPAPEDAALGLTMTPGDPAPSLRAAGAMPVVRTAYGQRDNPGTRLRDALAPDTDESAPPRRGRRLAKEVLDAAYPLYGAYPDPYRGWEEHAVTAGVAAIRQYGIGAVVSVSSPATAHIAAGEIARQAELPWIPLFASLASFRLDAGDGRTARRRMEHRVLAKRWLRGASRVAAIAPEMVEHLQTAYGIAGDTIVAPFDPEERRMPPRRVAGAPVRLLHVGRLGADLRGVELVAEALEQLLRAGTLDADALRVDLVGSGQEDALRARLATRPSAELFGIRERVTPAESLQLQREADMLLLIDTTCADPLVAYPLSLFEHVAARRPVLYVSAGAGGGFVERVLAETGVGTAVTTSGDLAGAIARAVAEVRATGELAARGDEAGIARYAGP
ncbi:MAG: glycosyltransferase-like protein, partial [Gemmatimonadetes bacterium]|nr:glycosyltransferase-like protein [Gemmatimonadota bacterium]